MMNSIALLNDAFRQTFCGGKVMMTIGVAELPDCVRPRRSVRSRISPGLQRRTIRMASTTSEPSISWVESSSGR